MISSVGSEHCLDRAGVTGSNPVSPTSKMENILFVKTFSIVGGMLLITTIFSRINRDFETWTELYITIVGGPLFLILAWVYGDQFPINIQETTEAMLVFLKAGGLKGGGVNFDAKLRRNSTDLEDLFLAHIGGADTFARALIIADKLLTDSPLSDMLNKRYASFDSGDGKKFEDGKLNLEDLYKLAKSNGKLALKSGKQELVENILFYYIK